MIDRKEEQKQYCEGCKWFKEEGCWEPHTGFSALLRRYGIQDHARILVPGKCDLWEGDDND